MSIEVIILIGVGIASLLFVTTYAIFFKLAEDRKWLLSGLAILIISVVAALIAIGVTVLLSFLVSIEIMVFVSAAFWGLGLGVSCGFMHYKVKHRTLKGTW